MPLSYAGYHHFIMMSLVSGEHKHLRCLFRMNPLVWCLWADVAAKLRSLKRYSVFTFQRMKFMNRTNLHYCRRSVLSLLISALIYAPPGMAAFTPDVIGVVNDETVDGSQKVDERGTTNNTHIINHGQQNVYGGISNESLIESGGYQDIGRHNNYVGQANNTTINGGRQTIHDGGISTGTIIEVAIRTFIQVVSAMERQLRGVIHT